MEAGNTAAWTGRQTTSGTTGGTAAGTAAKAPPQRVALGNAAALAQPAARPLAVPQAEADLRTRPILLNPPALPPRPAPVAPVAGPPPKRTPSALVREYLRELNPLQVLCWQVAAITVLLTVRQPWPVLTMASLGAAILLALTTVRLGGRWLYQLTGLAAAFVARQRRRDLPTTGGTPAATLGLISALLPGSTVRTVETSQGHAMAISHQGGMTAQLKPPALTPELLTALPMPAALLPAATREHEFGVHLVLHAGLRPDTPRRLWVAVHAARTVDTPVDAELTLALRNAMRRVRRALDRAGVPAQPLAEEQALSAIAGLAHITGGRTEVREDWRFWRTGPVSQATFQLTGWGALTDTQVRGLVGTLLTGVPGVATTVALGARTGRKGDPRGSATLRLAATTEATVATAARIVTDRLTPAGVRLARLDGAQLSGVAASLPIGVFLS